jgi:hypothetical protein
VSMSLCWAGSTGQSGDQAVCHPSADTESDRYLVVLGVLMQPLWWQCGV